MRFPVAFLQVVVVRVKGNEDLKRISHSFWFCPLCHNWPLWCQDYLVGTGRIKLNKRRTDVKRVEISLLCHKGKLNYVKHYDKAVFTANQMRWCWPCAVNVNKRMLIKFLTARAEFQSAGLMSYCVFIAFLLLVINFGLTILYAH